MTAIQWTTAIRDIVCYQAFGKAYTDLRTDEKAYLDATNTPTAPTSSPGGIAGVSLGFCRQYAQWFEELGTSTSAVPTTWDHVVIAETVSRCAPWFRGEKSKDAELHRNRAWLSAFETHAVEDFAFSATGIYDTSAKHSNLRLHIIRHCLRRGDKRNYLFPSPAAVDAAIAWARAHLWNRANLPFKMRQIPITINTASAGSAPTLTFAGSEVFDSVASRWLTYNDDSASAATVIYTDPQRIMYASATQCVELKARFGTETGKPRFFHIEDRGGGTYYWRFFPEPDQAYTVRAAVYTRIPTASTTATDSISSIFPPEYETLIADLALAKVLKDHAAMGWQPAWDTAMDQVEQLAASVSDPNEAAATEGLAMGDVYGDSMSDLGGL